MLEGEGMSDQGLLRLDEKGFVFIDGTGRPYHIRTWGGEPWLFYWHADDKWTSLRIVSQAEVWAANEQALPNWQAELYHDKHKASDPRELSDAGLDALLAAMEELE